MRSTFATLQRLVIPAGAGSGSPRMVLGPDVPAELVAHYAVYPLTVIAAILSYESGGGYYYDVALDNNVTNTGAHGRGFVTPAGTVLESTWEVAAFDGTDARYVYLGGFFSDGACLVNLSQRAGDQVVFYDGDGITVTNPQTVKAWTPVLTASPTPPNLGSSGNLASGRYWRDPITGWIKAQCTFRFGTVGFAAGNGTYLINLPTPASVQQVGLTTGLNDIVGHGTTVEFGVGGQIVQATLSNGSGGPGGVGQAALFFVSPTASGLVNQAAPFAWGANDGMAIEFHYRGA